METTAFRAEPSPSGLPTGEEGARPPKPVGPAGEPGFTGLGGGPFIAAGEGEAMGYFFPLTTRSTNGVFTPPTLDAFFPLRLP